MSLNAHISSAVRSASFHIRDISRIRKYLNPHPTEQFVHSFVTSRLDTGTVTQSCLDFLKTNLHVYSCQLVNYVQKCCF
ncbi:hypothetical protein HOLleu_41521 [Holothuria leucospilota]|uniref:Uncharacterized protein n=1 Tax=Holothuria leucospilota TaxID=206669 RepID=A0A9Q1BCP4_HOLLE|nr:hypothetical protein HOLleu_41521 [Holothuria leucospilota]